MEGEEEVNKETCKVTIRNVHTEQLATIVAGLVREGVTFRVDHNAPGSDYWTIILTGGF